MSRPESRRCRPASPTGGPSRREGRAERRGRALCASGLRKTEPLRNASGARGTIRRPRRVGGARLACLAPRKKGSKVHKLLPRGGMNLSTSETANSDKLSQLSFSPHKKCASKLSPVNTMLLDIECASKKETRTVLLKHSRSDAQQKARVDGRGVSSVDVRLSAALRCRWRVNQRSGSSMLLQLPQQRKS